MDNRRHFVLYAKGWYRKTDRNEDLKQILSDYTGIDVKFLHKDNLISILLELAFEFPSVRIKATDFIIGLAPCQRWKYLSNPLDKCDFEDALIGECLSYLMLTTREECDTVLGGLGSPDENVLPLRTK